MKVPKEFAAPDHPVLITPATPVDVADPTLLRDLSSGLERVLKTTTGIGLALPQVGVGLRGFIIRDQIFTPRVARICFNPRVVEASPEQETLAEGCLSLPKREFMVSRPKSVRVEYTNARGQPVRESLRGLPARVFQHELDHLDGLLISRFPEVGAPAPVRETIPPLRPPVVAPAGLQPGIYAIYGEDLQGSYGLKDLAASMALPEVRAGLEALRITSFESWTEAERKTAAQKLKGWIEDHPSARAEVYARFADAQVLLCRACPDLNGRVHSDRAATPAAPGE